MSGHEKENKDKCNNNNPLIIVVIVLLIIIAVLAFFAWKNIWKGDRDDFDRNTSTQSNSLQGTWSEKSNFENINVTMISDKRCSDCQDKEIFDSIKKLQFLSKSKFEIKDFSDAWVKDILKSNEISKLPAVLLNNKSGDSQFDNYLKETKAWLYNLELGSKFDPYAEICDNKVDDNSDNLVDCLDPTCGREFKCAPKVEKPTAELYVMSYCPYWLQAEKWYLEVMSKLWKVADVKVKFVQYIMHGQKEADENVKQHCIQEEQNDKYITYLKCFLDKEWKWESCIKESKLDEKKLKSCIDKTKKDFKVDELMADKSKQYPDFGINKEMALKAWVQGSPTFVVNWIKIEDIWRDAKSYADAICSTFKTKPKECEQEFQNVTFDPMFWFTTWQWANQANPQCWN